MYIQYQNEKYSCNCIIRENSISYTELPENFPETVEGEMVLCADDGFELRIDNTKNYLRQTFENGTLTLTNVLEKEFDPEPLPEPEPTADELLNAFLGVTSYE